MGPDITGSNRADLNYILENVLAPNAVLAKEYRMTVVQTLDGRLISGVLQNETDSAITLRTINDSVVVAKDDIGGRRLSELSVMPEGQLDQLRPEEVRDLIAYLAVPNQVTPRGPRAPIDATTGRVANAIEAESMRIVSQSAGKIEPQDMTAFSKDRWSGGQQLWWHGAQPASTMELEFEVPVSGVFDIEAVFTQAPDYGIVQLSLDGAPLNGPMDLYDPEVITTGVLIFPGFKLEAGIHKLSAKIVGANPRAVKGYMFGIDYLGLVQSNREQ